MRSPDRETPAAWYEDWFGRPEYKLVYRRRDEREAEQCIDLVETAVEPAQGSLVLDVACGRGRHARILARRGYRVTGIDLSTASLKEARRRARQENLSIDFEERDMRESVCQACFDGAVNLFTAFGYFTKEEDHQRALDAIAAALRPGGWFVQDFLNVAHVRNALVPKDTRRQDGATITQHRWIANQRINKRITIERADTQKTFHESVRLLTLDDFRRLYKQAGLRLVSTYGHYDGRAASASSPRLIMVSRKGE